ncbi:hypothetical protein [Nocardioides sp.]|uniref:hypothetical protein n=1 Tax=Nocardioides sp. TaxID=35761 RepID=UPI001A2CD4E9|nr:hypothetical protein [Nocardioides sp.]MBJ7358663.1 hypothetical protein [Nocardioides sp.]
MARLVTSDAGPLTLDEVASRAGSNTTRLHRLETGRLREGRLVDGYERALGLPTGALRAPIDVICRGFAYAPSERDPGPPVTSVRDMSRLTDRVSQPGATGGHWLTWARALAQPGAIGLPEQLAGELVRTLTSELARSVAHAYPTRYEALALVRCSAYGHLVLEVAQEVVSDPHVQVLYDLMSAVGEAPTNDAISWCLELLDQTREPLVVGGALALENMAEVSGRPDFWAGLVDSLVDAADRHPAGSVQHHWLSHLLRLVPRPLTERSARRPRRPLAPAADMPDWSRTRLNRHWSDCQVRAHSVTDSLGLPDQPVLARLLFDIAMGPHESRAVTSYMLLGALPRLRKPIGEHVADIAETHPDPVVRGRAARRLAGTLHGDHSAIAQRWITDGSPDERDRGFVLAGAAGDHVPEPLIREALATGPIGPPLYAAGMAGHACLRSLAGPRSLRPEVRGGARWWLSHGTRVAM